MLTFRECIQTVRYLGFKGLVQESYKPSKNKKGLSSVHWVINMVRDSYESSSL